MPGELAGKVAIVTGGASGIGRATVELFVKESANVVIADVNADGGEEVAGALGDAVTSKRTDVSSADDVRALVDLAVERFGGLHVMVNNAGIGGSQRRFLNDDFRDFDRVMAVNLLGVMLGTQHAARHMSTHGGGSIINTTSIAGINPGAGYLTQLHTHDTRGVIHVESPKANDHFTLGQFFAEWAVFLNSRCVGAYCNGLKWYVNGKQQTGDPQNYVLQSHDEIAIVVGKPPKKIPSSYQFLAGE